jgi:hypothetical protein
MIPLAIISGIGPDSGSIFAPQRALAAEDKGGVTNC